MNHNDWLRRAVLKTKDATPDWRVVLFQSRLIKEEIVRARLKIAEEIARERLKKHHSATRT